MGERKVRIYFGKGEAVRYISHLDLVRAWERALRRAGLPLAYSRGFNPHPRISIAMPLPVGCTGAREVIEVRLEEPPALATGQIAAALRPALPPGISLIAVERVPLDTPALASLPARATYHIVLVDAPADEVQRSVNEWLVRESSPVVRNGGHRRSRRGRRRTHTYDLRPLVESLKVRADGGRVLLEAVLLRDAQGRTGRPDTLVEALGLSTHVRDMHRVETSFLAE